MLGLKKYHKTANWDDLLSYDTHKMRINGFLIALRQMHFLNISNRDA